MHLHQVHDSERTRMALGTDHYFFGGVRGEAGGGGGGGGGAKSFPRQTFLFSTTVCKHFFPVAFVLHKSKKSAKI